MMNPTPDDLGSADTAIASMRANVKACTDYAVDENTREETALLLDLLETNDRLSDFHVPTQIAFLVYGDAVRKT